MISVLLSGYGHWGRVLARNLLKHPDFFLRAVHDPTIEARRDARSANLHTYRTLSDALDDTNAQLVIIAAPIDQQVESAILALQRHRDVMMAKPGPRTMIEVERLYRMADVKHRHLVVDYTMMMSDAYLHLQANAGDVYMFDAVRRAQGRRSSASIIDDLIVHDVAMLVGLDPTVSVASAIVTEDSAEIILTSSASGNDYRIVAEYDAEVSERRMIVNGEQWDQLQDRLEPGPVWRRLSSMRDVVRGRVSDNRVIVQQTTRILEEIRRCSI
jgi:predicted dehydrogenase